MMAYRIRTILRRPRVRQQIRLAGAAVAVTGASIALLFWPGGGKPARVSYSMHDSCEECASPSVHSLDAIKGKAGADTNYYLPDGYRENKGVYFDE
jgi:hypothetical protein